MKDVFLLLMGVAIAMVVAYLFEQKHLREFHGAGRTIAQIKGDPELTIDEILDVVSENPTRG